MDPIATDDGAPTAQPAPSSVRPTLARLVVIGQPVPQGSMTALTHRQTGRAMVKAGNERKLRSWRADVADEARAAAADMERPLDGPLDVECQFRLAMPKSRPKLSRELGVGPSTVRPDVDKLARAVLDALVSGGLIADDSRVSRLVATKRELSYGWLGVDVTIRRDAVFSLTGDGAR